MADLRLMPEDDYAPIRAAALNGLGNLLIAHFGGGIPAGLDFHAECDQLADMLGLHATDDQPTRESTREPGLRAVPADWTRRGAVGA